ncbi:metalloregulator ArsR/SmtB family transcription factor [Desulfobotulus sp. H1]|uniref:Metalloregulator ArsR/SmtB family transcription factor n=1 Tax=Desulfobotulus pelophilus TaxID=2823377 RepID=A0ABT3NBS9_9BACT|nr:metalloregulator ArsR/SmtB family transcription factor [Desulfobotulus pelophilus]MCW7754912.1 metalloregulator ArsR/SmtB family transcription factor [Desulfobotulus pelophilus]
MEDKTEEFCGEICVHGEVVAEVAAQMPGDGTLFRMAELFKAMGDPGRVRILKSLSFSDLCVCDIAELLSMSSSAVSHQLRVLRSARIVKFRKEGKNVVYSLDDAHIVTLLQQAEDHVAE